jgi:hypothetical protein
MGTMKQIYVAMVLGSLLLVSSVSANTDCSTADGQATYLESHSMGGPPPPPGYEVGRTEWKLGGKAVLRAISCTSPGPELPPEGLRGLCGSDEIKDLDLVAQFVPGNETILYQSPANEPWQVVKKYTSKVEIYRPSGKPLPNGLVRYDEFVICTYRQMMLP